MAALPLEDLLEDRARDGDGLSAVAFALLRIADVNEMAARAIDRLGLHYLNPDGVPGAVEKLGMEVRDFRRDLERIMDGVLALLEERRT